MGTNYYTLDDLHIGKRSAAGLYCWDCGITLCQKGEAAVHNSRSEWLDECPDCGKKELPAGDINRKPKSGVMPCCSFSWDMPPAELITMATGCPAGCKFGIKDEYGEEYTFKEFGELLSDCPIQYYDGIGDDFC